MNYLLRSREERRKPIRTTFVALVVALAVVFAVQIMFPGVYANLFEAFVKPVWQSSFAVRRAIGSGALDSKEALMKQNEELRGRITQIESKEASYDLLLQENASLKEILGRKEKLDLVLATVLKKPPRSAYDTLVVDVGRSSGIKPGDKVIAGTNVALGEVAEVGIGLSKVKLYSTPGEKYVVRIASSSIDVEAQGLGNGNFVASLPREVKVAEGDKIVIPSISPLLFATVSVISSDPARAYQTLLFKLPINVSLLSYVEIVRGENAEAGLAP